MHRPRPPLRPNRGFSEPEWVRYGPRMEAPPVIPFRLLRQGTGGVFNLRDDHVPTIGTYDLDSCAAVHCQLGKDEILFVHFQPIPEYPAETPFREEPLNYDRFESPYDLYIFRTFNLLIAIMQSAFPGKPARFLLQLFDIQTLQVVHGKHPTREVAAVLDGIFAFFTIEEENRKDHLRPAWEGCMVVPTFEYDGQATIMANRCNPINNQKQFQLPSILQHHNLHPRAALDTFPTISREFLPNYRQVRHIVDVNCREFEGSSAYMRRDRGSAPGPTKVPPGRGGIYSGSCVRTWHPEVFSIGRDFYQPLRISRRELFSTSIWHLETESELATIKNPEVLDEKRHGMVLDKRDSKGEAIDSDMEVEVGEDTTLVEHDENVDVYPKRMERAEAKAETTKKRNWKKILCARFD